MKVVFVIAQNDFRDEELFDTKAVLEQRGIEVKIAALTDKTARGMLGAMVDPDLSFSEIKVEKFDGVIFVGGPGAFSLIDNAGMHKLAADFFAADKVVAAICCAPAILAKAGLLHGKQATVAASFEEYLQEGKAQFIDLDVVRDGQIITANGPAAASAFGREISKALGVV